MNHKYKNHEEYYTKAIVFKFLKDKEKNLKAYTEWGRKGTVSREEQK